MLQNLHGDTETLGLPRAIINTGRGNGSWMGFHLEKVSSPSRSGRSIMEALSTRDYLDNRRTSTRVVI